MQPATGYFSIIQYCPDAARLEAANVGVVLYCPDRAFQKALVADDNARIRKFFGSEGHDWRQVNAFKAAIVERVQAEGFESLDGFKHYAASRGNLVALTVPRFVKVRDPEKDLERLFEQLITGQRRKKASVGLVKFVGRKLQIPGLREKVRSDLHITVPLMQKQIEIPFAFRNGRVNLIKPVRFASESEDSAITTACKYAIEGESLYEKKDDRLGELRLVVVGKFGSKKIQDTVSRILDANKVRLFRHDALDTLLAEIRDTGKEWQEPEHTSQT